MAVDDHSGDAPVRGPLAVLALLGAIAVLLGMWAGLKWSLITVGVHGRVTSAEMAEEGPRFRVIELNDGTVLTVDETVMRDLGGRRAALGRELSKAPGDHDLVADDESIALRPSSAAWTTVAALVSIVALALIRGKRVRRNPPAT